ncbi:hypothetical protein JHK82_049337 [Glycine max]|nr:hypothetical protein JHK85_049955 [Glycine max]KAG5090559.1 hypothetical protein JHK82_049337 [Glycine max]KAG5093645.1 hypothetical protein JHK84_049233 [Glycine max]
MQSSSSVPPLLVFFFVQFLGNYFHFFFPISKWPYVAYVDAAPLSVCRSRPAASPMPSCNVALSSLSDNDKSEHEIDCSNAWGVKNP